MSDYSPMMQKYLETKEEYKDCILFYRLGDFYEMFFEDAKVVSKELDLVLTGKNCGTKERAPMCGVPFHAADSYVSRLVKAGYKVAICEQMEDPKNVKGIVPREVIRIVTPSTNIDTAALSEDKNNYLCAIVYQDQCFGMAFADVSTGDFYATEVYDPEKMQEECSRFSPAEIIVNEAAKKSASDFFSKISDDMVPVSEISQEALEEKRADEIICEQFKVKNLRTLGLDALKVGALSCAAALSYLHDTQHQKLKHMRKVIVYSDASFMILDNSTRRNLELTETMREKEKKGSLFGVLDRTRTAMGARLLRSYIEQPLVDVKAIKNRQNAIDEFTTNKPMRQELREALNDVYDLERLITRVSYMNANPRDILALKQSIGAISRIQSLMEDVRSDALNDILKQLDPLSDIHDIIEASIADEPPISVHDGGIIRDGFSEEVDHLRKAGTDGKNWLARLESDEREKTGIKNLKIKYNKVFGYYLEVTKSNLNQVPDYFIRKQTLTNAERFFTPELKELENTILGSQDRLVHLEYDLYSNILGIIFEQVEKIQQQAKLLARLDVLLSLADVAVRNRYTKPEINSSDVILIKEGRHPVIEQHVENSFIPNDTKLDEDDTRITIITGPNMAGKSTYMRQCALIVLMAQIGSFVPASEASIGIVDRIFTRVGASDDLASGQSTFMVEMSEVANILNHATSKSLLILDEIGRGTSTFDGLAIAWAVVEYISDKSLVGAKTLFATHYHELTELEGRLDGVKNYCIAVKEHGEDIIFLRKIIPGGADKSYGIQVARLAGVPQPVIERAKKIVEELVENDVAGVIKEAASNNDKEEKENKQLSLFDRTKPVDERQNAKDQIYKELLTCDVNNMTPMEALLRLSELQTIAKDW